MAGLIALICKGNGADVLSSCDQIFDVVRINKLSELRQINESKQLECIFLDKALEIGEQLKNRFPDLAIFEYQHDDFHVDEAMVWLDTIAMNQKDVSTFQENHVPMAKRVAEKAIKSEVVDHKSEIDSTADPPERHQIQITGRNTPVFMLEGPKGGAGRSTIGAHMAYYGAMKGKRVAIIDLDPNGDIAAMLGLLNVSDVRGWRGSSVKQAVQDQICLVHSSGLHLFPSPQDKTVVLQNSNDALFLLKLCMDEMDAVFLDMPQGWTPIHTEVLPLISQVILVVTPAVDRLDRVREHAEKLEHAGLTPDQVIPVLNKSKKKSDHRALEQYLFPFKTRLVLPYDPEIERKGGLHGRRFIKTSKAWWDEMYGFNQSLPKKRRGWFF